MHTTEAGAMTCKQLFNNFSCNFKQMDQKRNLQRHRPSYDELEDEETVDSPNRPSAMKFLKNGDSAEDLDFDSCMES